MSQLPQKNLYQKYENPYKVAEFRLFSFNNCSSSCKNCFYQKTQNHFFDFEKAHLLSSELLKYNYHLETCYLLPTDVFDNQFNYKLFESQELKNCLHFFDYVGVATTMKNGYDELFFETFWTHCPQQKLEIHLNLIEESLGDENYLCFLEKHIQQLKARFQEKVLINMAFNCGTSLTEQQRQQLHDCVARLSEDKILEVNFTFLFNKKIPHETKQSYFLNSLPFIQFWRNLYKVNDLEYNQRTSLRKPSFTFKDGKIYLSPILPFDEYIFLDDKIFQLKTPTVDSFLETYAAMEKANTPIMESCPSCPDFNICYGKQYFTIAHFLNVSCHKYKSNK